MNIVFDSGLKLEEGWREFMVPILPAYNAPLKLNSMTSKTDGTLSADEGIVFLTNLPIDVLKYHSEFFKLYNDAPQWFFILLNRNDHGLTDLKNAARKTGLKNCLLFHAGNAEAFKAAIKSIAEAEHIKKGKTLILTKHRRNCTSSLAYLLFGSDEQKYEIMNSNNVSKTDSDIILLCGEKASDFKGITYPKEKEPYFVVLFKEDPQIFIDSEKLINELAEYHHMTSERVETRLFFIDIESEMWLEGSDKPTGGNAVKEGILLFDRFGLPVSREEYTEQNITAAAKINHNNFEKLKEILM